MDEFYPQNPPYGIRGTLFLRTEKTKVMHPFQGLAGKIQIRRRPIGLNPPDKGPDMRKTIGCRPEEIDVLSPDGVVTCIERFPDCGSPDYPDFRRQVFIDGLQQSTGLPFP
jgi:hypothetical protein